MTNTNYALSFIDSEGVEQIINSSGDIVILNGSVLFNSFDNAEKASKKLKNRLKKGMISPYKYWHDQAISNPSQFVNPGEGDRYIKKYRDMSLIESNEIEVKEVVLTIN